MRQMNENPTDPLFKGCTRPAMQFGVPLTPLVIVGGTVILISVWTSILVATTLVPIVLVMRQITKSDDQQFRLLGLKIMYRANNKNRKFWKSSTYSPVEFRRKNMRFVS